MLYPDLGVMAILNKNYTEEAHIIFVCIGIIDRARCLLFFHAFTGCDQILGEAVQRVCSAVYPQENHQTQLDNISRNIKSQELIRYQRKPE